jgi:hypothetical protein
LQKGTERKIIGCRKIGALNLISSKTKRNQGKKFLRAWAPLLLTLQEEGEVRFSVASKEEKQVEKSGRRSENALLYYSWMRRLQHASVPSSPTTERRIDALDFFKF